MSEQEVAVPVEEKPRRPRGRPRKEGVVRLTPEEKLKLVEAEEVPEKGTLEFYRYCGKKGGLKGKRRLTKREARRMVEARTKKAKERLMGPRCLKCQFMDQKELLCKYTKCKKEEIDAIIGRR